jgi:hypothetical protein
MVLGIGEVVEVFRQTRDEFIVVRRGATESTRHGGGGSRTEEDGVRCGSWRSRADYQSRRGERRRHRTAIEKWAAR